MRQCWTLDLKDREYDMAFVWHVNCQQQYKTSLDIVEQAQSHIRVTDDVKKINAAKLKRGDETERGKNRLNFCLSAVPVPASGIWTAGLAAGWPAAGLSLKA